MTTESINDFAKAVRADEKMARELVAAIGQKQGGDAAEAFAAFAQGRGFAVTREDAVALQNAASNPEGVLSDEELDGVAGGGRVAQSYGPDMWRRPSHVTATLFIDGRYQTF